MFDTTTPNAAATPPRPAKHVAFEPSELANPKSKRKKRTRPASGEGSVYFRESDERWCASWKNTPVNSKVKTRVVYGARHKEAILLGVAGLWGVLASGCSAGTAAVGLSDCGNNTMTCCIQKHPYDPAGACGATAADIEEAIGAGVVIGAGAMVENALQRRTDEGADEGEEADDPDEGWREHCRDLFVQCRDQKKPRWVGNCYDCFRWCEGQHQWPFQMCWQKTR
jgi:hypothetical protein